ncbi:nitrogenase component 1 [Propionispora hippei]|uniref:Nitrogenase molybdenum-iron protein beta chain n=1 Tax=Propionispora hippei DSM 15287 TaxID=1123003 RepID=A0A1M6EC52_9FIRM|nr:nitrogenase component 1 [Propionispora hippei]SHI82959.1 nitrogenase molybdenum-iron protein beta chain [Propionispora hippei DSM 15287]
MSRFVEQVRHVCALGGYQSVLAIEKAAPILHAGPGCGQKLWRTLGSANGCQGSGYVGGHSVPCTNIGEKEVIFGGDDRLRDIVGNALKVIDAGLFVILTGCTSDIVGDDVSEVARRFQEQGKPVVAVETGGFKGSNLFGHELVLDAIIEQYLQPAAEKEAGLVNIWAVVPYQDPFWVGNLREIEKLVALLGLTPNIIFGPGNGLEALQRVPKAQFNLLVSPWVGLKNVKHLEAKFGTPYLHYPVLPIGPTETANFLRTVGTYAGIEGKRVEKIINKLEQDYYYYIDRAADSLLETQMMPRRFVSIADSFYALGVARFLINDLGLLPETQYITDGVAEEYQDSITEEFKKFEDGIEAKVIFSNDGGEIHEDIRKLTFRSRPLILGSAWDRVLSREINGYQLSLATPVTNRLVLNRSYVGYEGALRLVEDIYSLVLEDFQ